MTTLDQIEQALLTAVGEIVQPGVQANATPRQIGMDSLDAVEVLIAVEASLSVEIPDEWLLDDDQWPGKTFHEMAVFLHENLNEN